MDYHKDHTSEEGNDRNEEKHNNLPPKNEDDATISSTYTAEERQKILTDYRNLLRSIKVNITAADSKNIRAAFELAEKAHLLQKRKSGEPYILHPIEVARICAAEMELGATSIIAALLHDVVEDTDTTIQEIEKIFGKKTATIVDGLTKLDAASDATASLQAENLKKVLFTLTKDARVIFIKIADRLHNMRTLGAMPANKQLKIASETSYIYAPMAHRLGFNAIKSELQDLCLKVTNREDYDEIAKKLQVTKKSREKYIEEFIAPLKEVLDMCGFPYRIFGRSKSIFSIYNKIKEKNVPFEEIYDLFAVRVIVDTPDDKMASIECHTAQAFLTSKYPAVAGRTKNWITTPKANGYRSFHTTVIGPQGRFVEVQIRTKQMDEIAEMGLAAHWKYKKVNSHGDIFDRWFSEVRETLSEERKDGNAVDFLLDFKTSNLFEEEVFVYTPKGEMKVMKKGATVLDFAFAVHSDVGYHCYAAKVNSVHTPLNHPLKSGDQVNIVTRSSQKPNESWLAYVTTSKAKEKIRSALREEQMHQAEFGKEALLRKLDGMKINQIEDALEFLVKHFGYKTRMDFYYAITTQVVELQTFNKVFRVEKGKIGLPKVLPDVANNSSETVVFVPKPTIPKDKMQLFIDDEPAYTYQYEFATCCNPMAGDKVFAYISAGNQTKIHRANCPNAANMTSNFSYRIKNAEWGAALNGAFITELKITGVDTGIGVLENLMHLISAKLELNIKALSIESNQGFYECTVRVVVANKDQLTKAIGSLKEEEGITGVMRF